MASPNSTLPNDNKEAQDSAYNPGEQAYLEGMGSGHINAGIDQAEAFANDPKNHSDADDIRESENNTNWKSNFSGSGGGKQSTIKLSGFLKKRGPLATIIGILFGGGIIGTVLFSPGILLVQMKESLVDRFNTQLTSMDARSTKILNSKITGSTSGLCGERITIKCKYTTISQKQADRLKAAGIEVEGDTKFGSRIKPSSYIFNGEKLSAKDFATKSYTDPNLRSALRKAYNPKFAGFSDSVWSGVAKKLGISKQRALVDGDADAKTKALDDSVKNGSKVDIANDGVTCNGDVCKDREGRELTTAQKAARQAAIDAAEEAVDEGAKEAGESALSNIENSAGKTAFSSVANFVKLTGAVDTACQAYSSVRALGYAAKTIRAIQLARYAMVFINTADQIKAGTAKPEDVAYLGGILTNVAYDVKSGVKRKAAMDSAGMQYSMFGTTAGFRGQGSSYVSQFMAGGGLTGDLITITDYINSVLGGGARGTCRTLSNGWVQAGSVVAGIALMLIPGVNVAIGVGDVVKGALSVAAGVALAVLPDLLKSIVAGNVTEGLVGEDSGNAIASGFGVIASDTAQAGGNAPMSIDDAVAYTTTNNQIAANYAADEARTLSPLDATNKNTFLGSIVSKFLPYVSSEASISNPFLAFSGVVSQSFASIIPTSSALSTEETKAAYSSCNDPDYKDLGIAADPFCNPVFGIPTQYLSKDPVTVADELTGQYDETTGAPIPNSQYADYVKNCIEREDPIGSGGQDDSGNDGSQCKITPQNADFYLFYMDQRVDSGMDGYDQGGTNVSQDITDKKTLAQKIVAKNKISYLGNVQPKIEDIANGTVDPNAEPCGININILKIIDAITDSHSIKISDINRHCTNSTANGLSSTSSRHYAGNGSAIDIAVADGVILKGRDATSISLINTAMPILSAAAVNGQTSSVGQSQCGTAVTLGTGVKTFNDGCTHVHFDVPPDSDPNLKHS